MSNSKQATPAAKRFTKATNTRAIGPATVITGYYGGYSPNASSARATHLSWQALQQALAAHGGTCTVAQYMAVQAKVNPNNTGDALPFIRYAAGNGNVGVKSA